MKKYNCFSLVELLTVIVIASILLAIAVPAVSSMIRGSASTQAGRELMGRIKAARAYAVSKQTPVAIVFYTTEVPSGATLSPDYACSAYRICTVKYMEPTKENNNWKGWVFQDWVSEWYFLPKGIAIGLPETMTASLPGSLSDVGAGTKESADSLIRTIGSSNGTVSTEPVFFASGEKGSGVSPVYFCDLSDIYPGKDSPVVFRNAIIFNAAGMMEKPKNLALNDKADSLQPDKAVIIPLRTALIDGNTVTVEGEPKEYIPVRVDPSGKTYFYDGFVSF
ncbi:MAG: prepilin-type N-terminal cleavage/methylation domain-containing protein [Lentisphaeria bacterium]|nr:prepilin-type N-terminal cleavage/methylation domain-containing protein [Lentisphaeria bacterium]